VKDFSSSSTSTSTNTVRWREDEVLELAETVRNLGAAYVPYAVALEEKSRDDSFTFPLYLNEPEMAFLFALIPVACRDKLLTIMEAEKRSRRVEGGPSAGVNTQPSSPPKSPSMSPSTEMLIRSLRKILSPASDLASGRVVPGVADECPPGSGASAVEVARKVGNLGAEYKSYAAAIEESGTLDGAFLSRLRKRHLDLLFIFVCRRHQANLEEKVFDVAKAIHGHGLMPLPKAVQRWIERK
jgi:hypothetical protein